MEDFCMGKLIGFKRNDLYVNIRLLFGNFILKKEDFKSIEIR